jgi:hypothetical protein
MALHWSIREKLERDPYLRQVYDEYWLWHGCVWGWLTTGRIGDRHWDQRWHV